MLVRILRNKKLRVFSSAALRFTALIGKAIKKWGPVDRVFGQAACGGVQFYRQVISPRKGYRCAYALTTGGPSCSAVALSAFQTVGFSGGFDEMTAQFDRCEEAQRSLQLGLIDEALITLMKVSSDWPKDPGGGGCCKC